MNPKRAWAAGAALFAAGLLAGLWLLRDTLLPLFVAFALAYACSPAVNRLVGRGLSRSSAVLLVMLGVAATLAALTALVLPPLFDEARELAANFPDYVATAARKVADVAEQFGIRVPLRRAEVLEKVRSTLQLMTFDTLLPAADVAKKVFSGAVNVVLFVLNLLIVPVLFYFCLLDLSTLKRSALDFVPPAWRGAAERQFHKIDGVLSGFIRGQGLVALILAGVFGVSLTIMGVKFGLLIGIAAGLLNIIPYVGQLTGWGLATIMALVDFTSWGRVLAIAALFGATNFVEGQFLTPKVVGDRVGLTPVQSILALIVGGKLGGFVGLLLGIPAAGALKVVLSDVFEAYRRSDFYKSQEPAG